MSRGFLSGGLCPGGFCPGGFCPDTIGHRSSSLPKSMFSSLKAHSCLIQTKGKRSFLTILNETGHSENKVIM